MYKPAKLQMVCAAVIFNIGAVMVASASAMSEDLSPVPAAPQATNFEEPVFNELSDELHFINKSLSSDQSAHYYGFIALRGQKVLLATPAGAPEGTAWKFEYHKDGEWKEKVGKAPLVFDSLRAGEFIIVRVKHRENNLFTADPYIMALGSYPVMTGAEMTGPAGIRRVPAGDTSRVLGTQTHSELTFKAKFTDSTGVALKGGLAMVRILLKSTSAAPDIKKYAFSDSRGEANLEIVSGKCSAGELISRQNEPDLKNKHWVSDYNVAGWYAFNGLLGDESLQQSAKHVLGIAHICNHRLKTGVVNR
jgi:hypothetical protein